MLLDLLRLSRAVGEASSGKLSGRLACPWFFTLSYSLSPHNPVLPSPQLYYSLWALNWPLSQIISTINCFFFTELPSCIRTWTGITAHRLLFSLFPLLFSGYVWYITLATQSHISLSSIIQSSYDTIRYDKRVYRGLESWVYSLI